MTYYAYQISRVNLNIRFNDCFILAEVHIKTETPFPFDLALKNVH
jgi:hypothetical protein